MSCLAFLIVDYQYIIIYLFSLTKATMARFPLAIKVFNVLVYIFLLGSNVYSGLDPNNKNNSPYGGKHITFISPAPFVFGVWGLIHFLLGGFVIYQWFANQDLVLDGINWHFVSITVLNVLWLALWESDHLILAWITILITTIPVTIIYTILKQRSRDVSLNEPTVGYLYKGEGDFSGSLVIAWYLYGVAVEQNDAAIHWTALVLAIINSIFILVSIVQKIRHRGEESTPLLG
ncbi:hypothetical protein RCL_jg11579.t1 [Rhizophagus clarus]|uniref:Uncharacterized protein n=1 Tax=Rhizophagus clarus TaxID=94130 RepID=A0A8H3LBR7_9GLOM|nr:hypothetical protein RCL_jg11579.t1 [Rhizophagus clarus]